MTSTSRPESRVAPALLILLGGPLVVALWSGPIEVALRDALVSPSVERLPFEGSPWRGWRVISESPRVVDRLQRGDGHYEIRRYTRAHAGVAPSYRTIYRASWVRTLLVTWGLSAVGWLAWRILRGRKPLVDPVEGSVLLGLLALGFSWLT